MDCIHRIAHQTNEFFLFSQKWKKINKNEPNSARTTVYRLVASPSKICSTLHESYEGNWIIGFSMHIRITTNNSTRLCHLDWTQIYTSQWVFKFPDVSETPWKTMWSTDQEATLSDFDLKYWLVLQEIKPCSSIQSKFKCQLL